MSPLEWIVACWAQGHYLNHDDLSSVEHREKPLNEFLVKRGIQLIDNCVSFHERPEFPGHCDILSTGPGVLQNVILFKSVVILNVCITSSNCISKVKNMLLIFCCLISYHGKILVGRCQ